MASNRKKGSGIYEIVVKEHQRLVLHLRGTDVEQLIGTAKVKLVGNNMKKKKKRGGSK